MSDDWGIPEVKAEMSDDWGVPEEKAALSEQAATPLAAEATDRPKKPIGDWGKPSPNDYSENDNERKWGSNAVVYEWAGDEGDVGPENPDLEIQLFGEPGERQGAGLDFSKIADISVLQEGEKRITPFFEFDQAGLHPVMLKNVQMSGYKAPTPIQKFCIPAINMGYDLIAVAQTGSGKTAAYLIPILNLLMGKAKKIAAPRPNPMEFQEGTAAFVRAEPLVLVVCPTRELAIQIFSEARKFCYRTMLRPCVIYGGGPLREQLEQIGRGCDLLIGTPGRLIDVMQRGNALTFRRLRYMVIDEADEMLNSDWQDELEKIVSGGEQEDIHVKYMLFSATFPGAVRALAKKYLAENYLRVHVGRIGSSHANIKQDVIFVRPDLKKDALIDLLYSMHPARTIIFVNNKRVADEIDDFLFHKDLPCTSMHSDRTQREREDAMRAFRSGRTPLLIATGVSARGIDVRNVANVINYDLPSVDHGGIQEYVHRIGRTGRIGYTGTATSFYTERDSDIAEDLTKMLMETKQQVPDFLQPFIPEGCDPNNFTIDDDKSDIASEDDWAGEGDIILWGADHQPIPKVETDSNDWGAESKAAATDDWGAEPKAAATDDWGTGDQAKPVGDNGSSVTKIKIGGNDWGTESKGTANDGWGAEPKAMAK
ncbi:P-loop containing nucleoside triphosphate hydrolase protein [Hypoxylon crocopeplum]|nr:P-loop containing nucleoside triphosphate hydrolase protein [Hypoxylon crocopeplum]